MREMVRGFLASGLSPERVAELVLEAIREERLHILTHPSFTPFVRDRMTSIVEGRNPTFGGFGRS
jgi:hypothetical protein